LELEVPEIYAGTVEIKAIAREPGSRSKVAVAALQPGVDPVGSCVGMRGVRIQNIVNELNGEKIDVVAWSADDKIFIGSALSPAKVVSVALNEPEKAAKVVVPDRSLSLAIGKEGQNARLAAKLTGWRIDIKSETEALAEAQRLAAEAEEAAKQAAEMEEARRAAAELLAVAQASLDEEEEAEEPETVEAVAVEQAAIEGEAVVVVAEEPEVVAEEAIAEAPLEATTEVVVPESQPTAEAAVPEAPMAAAPEAEVTVVEAGEVLAPVVEGEGTSEEWTEDEEGESEEGEEGEEGMTAAQRKKALDKKNRQRLLEFDERLGRVVARKKRKPSRQNAWDNTDEDYSE
jgi:transcription antitermination factor NusA-like protein